MTQRVLLTTVCRPLGERYGDAKSVGYELLFGQVTRAQGMFSPRAVHEQFALDYIAENLEAPTVVLQYPSRRELIRELRRGYDLIGVAFVLATFHRMKELVALVHEYSPSSRIVLGGYGTSLPDDVLGPYSDHRCREEGVGFMRRLLGEPPIAAPYRHPLAISRLRLFGLEVSRTGMVFAGLGCPNGCDFCCTSHFFKRRHIRLLPTGTDIYRVVERYLEVEPEMSIVVMDEDFLLDRRRALEFRDRVLESGRDLSMFVFASVRAISRFTVEELVEMGIDGVWVGYEGTRSGYAKQSGRPVGELFRDLRQHGITILASMIIGFDYQTRAVVEEELKELLELEPTFAQFMIYTPMLGTPLHEQVVKAGRLNERLSSEPESYYHDACGFTAMVSHPTMTATEIEELQQYCFDQDYQRLGPSIFRSLETALIGYERLIESRNPALRRRAERLGRDIRRAYPAFLPGRLFGPNRAVRRRIAELERRVFEMLGSPTIGERLKAVASVAMAAWTGLTLALGFRQHPRLVRHTYRMPARPSEPGSWARVSEDVALRPRADVELPR